MNNETGEIYASHEERIDQFELIASNLEEAICRLTTLCDVRDAKNLDPEESVIFTRFEAADKLLSQYGLSNGPHFVAKNGKLENVTGIIPGPYHYRERGVDVDIEGDGTFFWREFLLAWI